MLLIVINSYLYFFLIVYFCRILKFQGCKNCFSDKINRHVEANKLGSINRKKRAERLSARTKKNVPKYIENLRSKKYTRSLPQAHASPISPISPPVLRGQSLHPLFARSIVPPVEGVPIEQGTTQTTQQPLPRRSPSRSRRSEAALDAAADALVGVFRDRSFGARTGSRASSPV